MKNKVVMWSVPLSKISHTIKFVPLPFAFFLIYKCFPPPPTLAANMYLCRFGAGQKKSFSRPTLSIVWKTDFCSKISSFSINQIVYNFTTKFVFILYLTCIGKKWETRIHLISKTWSKIINFNPCLLWSLRSENFIQIHKAIKWEFICLTI